MKTDQLQKRILALIDRHSAHPSGGRKGRESGTPATLAKRLGVPADHVQALIKSGRLVSLGAVNRYNPEGAQSYDSAHLNEIRRETITAIVEDVIDGMPDDATEEAIISAVSHALDTYQKNLAAPAAKEFSARQDDERPGLLKRAATGALVAGGAYAGLSYLRGRKIGAKGILPALKSGNAANIADVRKAGSAVAGLFRRSPSPSPVQSGKLTPSALQRVRKPFVSRPAVNDGGFDYGIPKGTKHIYRIGGKNEYYGDGGKQLFQANVADLTPARARVMLSNLRRELRRIERA